MRASQREREKKEKRKRKKEEYARTHMRVYAPGLAVSFCVPRVRACVCVYNTFYRRPRRTTGTATVRRLARSPPPLPLPFYGRIARPLSLVLPPPPPPHPHPFPPPSSFTPLRLPVSFSPVSLTSRPSVPYMRPEKSAPARTDMRPSTTRR